MHERDPNIVNSGLSRTVTAQGARVEVMIYRLEHDPQWALEVVNENGTSTVWDNLFDTDEEASEAFDSPYARRASTPSSTAATSSSSPAANPICLTKY